MTKPAETVAIADAIDLLDDAERALLQRRFAEVGAAITDARQQLRDALADLRSTATTLEGAVDRLAKLEEHLSERPA
jgi:hypothetical protein